jgi:hypothetical protein
MRITAMAAAVKSAILSACFFLVLGGTILPALADDAPLYVAPGPSTIVSTDTVKRYQQSATSSRKLGDIIGGSLKSPSGHATDLVVTTKCGRYQSATITYSDGSAKTMNLGGAPATKTDMEQAKAAIPILRIVDMGECND